MSGIKKYIDDLNVRFNSLFLPDLTKTVNGEEVSLSYKFSGLANVNYRTGLPYVLKSNGDYEDVLFNDAYDLTLFYFETGDRKGVSGGFQSPCDIIVCANMNSFSGYNREEIIDEIHEVMKVTAFGTSITGYARDFEALKGFTYQEKVKETMNPYFVFRIKTNLVGILNTN